MEKDVKTKMWVATAITLAVIVAGWIFYLKYYNQSAIGRFFQQKEDGTASEFNNRIDSLFDKIKNSGIDSVFDSIFSKQAQEVKKAAEETITNIRVETPAAFAVIASPFVVKGRALIDLEAVNLALKDSAGNVLFATTTPIFKSATEGDKFGLFVGVVDFVAPTSTEGTLEAVSGSEENKVSVPIKFKN